MKFLAGDDGNIAITTALLAGLLVSGVGIVLTLSTMGRNGSQLQDAADAAALSTVRLVSEGAIDSVADNHARSVVLGSVRMNPAPEVATNVRERSPALVEVRATGSVETIFGGVLGRESAQVTRISLARVGASQPICLLVLSPTGASTLSSQGGAGIQAPQCGAQVNSTAAGTVQTGGNSSLYLRTLRIVGPEGGLINSTPAPRYNQPAVRDPLAERISWPTAGGCDRPAQNVAGTQVSLSASGQGVMRICGGIEVSNGGVLTLGPGVYVLTTGDFRVRSGGIVRAAGATVVLLGSTATVNFGSGADVTLPAPTSGPWAHIAIAVRPQPREQTSEIDGVQAST